MAALSYCGNHVCRHDPDRYLTALFLPRPAREHVFALYAFNAEIARARDVVSEVHLGAIRLQWWREAIGEIYAGRTPRAQPIVETLAEAIEAHSLPAGLFEQLIAAREADLEPQTPANLGDLEHYASETAAPLQCLAARSLGAVDVSTDAAAAAGGIAWALTGLLRAVPYHARAKRLYLPQDLFDQHRISRRDLFELRPTAGLPTVVQTVANRAWQSIAEVRQHRRQVPQPIRPLFLTATAAAAYLRALRRVDHDVFALPRRLPGLSARLAVARLLGRY